MRKVRLLYAANTVTEQEGVTEQNLYFLIQVKNLEFAKIIDVVWAGADGVWHTLPATFHSMTDDDSECWNATAVFASTDATPLPRNIQFSVRYRVKGKEYWANNDENNYFIPVRAALQGVPGNGLLNIGFRQHLEQDQRHVPVTVAVNAPTRAQEVSLHWTSDDWQHTHVTPCQLKTRLVLETSEQIIEDGAQIWCALLDIGADFRLQYSICCETDKAVFWDNNSGLNYSASRKPLNVLVLNLHCCQEDNQDYKFSQIAKAIDELCVDIVCLQEVAENWNDAQGDWASNSARIINDRLKEPYHIHTDWSHLGFVRYREGVAILSRYPFAKYDARFLSNSQDPYSIHTRKGVMGQVDVPYFGLINVFSVHTSWWADGFAEQFRNLRDWAEGQQGSEVRATLLCGDFNIKAGSDGYELVVASDVYDDEFLGVTSPKVFTKIFRERRDDWPRYLRHDGRIDYVFRARSSALRATAARFVFTPQEYGRVSDHEGLLMTFEQA